MALTDPPDGHLSDHPELLRLAALLLRDPPAVPHIGAEVTARGLGVTADSDAEALLGQLIFHAPDGPDAHPDTLVRYALSLGLTRLADRETSELAKRSTRDADWARYLEIRRLLRTGSGDTDALVTEALALCRVHGFTPQQPETVSTTMDHPPALAESLRLAGIEPNGTLLESCELSVQMLLVAQQELKEPAKRRHDVYLQRFYELRAAGLKIQELELALRKRQATVDRQGDELSPLRQLQVEVAGITGSQATGRALAVALHDFVQRLRERTREAEQDANREVRRAVMAEKRHTLEPSPGDHSDGPASRLLRRMREDMGPPHPCHFCGGRGAIGDGLCANCMGSGATPLVGPVESGPCSKGKTFKSSAEFAAWLREDGGPDDKATAVLGEGGVYISPDSDPALVALLGLDNPLRPCLHTAERESGKRVPAGAGNRPTEVCSACRSWRVMGPGESWRPAAEPYPEGSA